MKWLYRLSPLLAVLLALGGFHWSSQADEARWGTRPPQFYHALAGEPRIDGTILSVAHNAGDGAPALDLALAHGADVIEIDVIAIDGRLYAAHDPPPDWLPSVAYRGPTLGDAWKRTDGARFVELDLKDSSAATVRLLASFLEKHGDERRVLVAARDIHALETLRERSPHAFLLLSIGDARGLRAVRDDPEQTALVNGVTVRADLLDAATVAWFKDRGLFVVVWTVNDLAQLNDLSAAGVDAVTSDNLAILDALRQAEARHPAAGERWPLP
jgi:glycerophosphoryl diester phosphodiesterase